MNRTRETEPGHETQIDHEIYGVPPGDCRTHPREWDCLPETPAESAPDSAVERGA